MPRCLIRTCPISSSVKAQEFKVHLHVFPKELEKIKTWLMCTGHPFKDLDAFANRIFDSKSNDTFRICSAHFTKDSYIMNGNVQLLHPDAMPCIFQVIPGRPIINEERRLRVVKNRKPPPPPPPSVAGSSSQSEYLLPVKKAVMKVDSDTQTDLQYTMRLIKEDQPFSAGLQVDDYDQGYKYLISTPLLLREGKMSSEANDTYLEIPIRGNGSKTEMVHTRVALLSSGSNLISSAQPVTRNIKVEECDDVASFDEQLGLHIVKVEESGVDIDSFNEDYHPCKIKEEESGIDIASFNEEHHPCKIIVEGSSMDSDTEEQEKSCKRVKIHQLPLHKEKAPRKVRGGVASLKPCLKEKSDPK